MIERSDQFGFPGEPLILSDRWALGDIFIKPTKCQFVARLENAIRKPSVEFPSLINRSESGVSSFGKLMVWSSEVRMVAIKIVTQYRGKSFGLKMSTMLSRDFCPSPNWIR